MDIFSEVNKISQNANKRDATVVRVESYHLDRDPRKCHMIAHDLMNMDENGVPKKVKVNFYDKNGKSKDIQDFADDSNMVHTMPGGKILLDKFVVRADGSYLTSHMQRVEKKEGPRVDRNGNEHVTGLARAWVKVYPTLDENRNIAEIKTSTNNLISRGRVMVVPEESEPNTLTFGNDFLAQFKAAAKKAIDNAPDKTKPMLLVRQENSLQAKEVVIPHQKKDEAGNYVPMSKDDQLAIFDKLKVVQDFLQVNANPNAQGQTVEAVPGCQMDVYGMLNDPKQGTRLDKPRVQEMVKNTSRNFALPKEPGQQKQEMVPHNKPEYKLSVISYEIPQSPESNMASLNKLGAVPGTIASPNAGLSVTPNPYYAAPGVAQAEKASQQAQANQNNAAAPAANEQAAPPAQSQQADQQADQQAQAQAEAQAQAYQEEPSEDELDDAMDDMMNDFDIDDLEQQLGTQSL